MTDYAYVTLNGISSLVRVNLDTFTVDTTISAFSANSVVFDSPPSKFYTSANGDNTMEGGTLSPFAIVSNTPVDASPKCIVIDPTSTYCYLASHASNVIDRVDLSSLVVTYVTVGTGPNFNAIDPVGSYLYTVCGGSNNAYKVDLATFSVIGSPLSVGGAPQSVTIDPAGTYAYVTNYTDNTVSVIDLATFTVAATHSVLVGPAFMAIDPAGTYGYILSNTQIQKIALSGFTSVATLTSGSQNRWAVCDAAGAYLYVTDSAANLLYKIDLANFTGAPASLAIANGPSSLVIEPGSSSTASLIVMVI